MEVDIYSEMPVHQSTRRHTPEGLNIHWHDCENLKSQTKIHVRPVLFISRTGLKLRFKKHRVCMSFKVHFVDISGWAAWFRVTGVRCVKAPCRFYALSAGPWATVGQSTRRTTGPSTKRFALHTAFSVLKRLAGNKYKKIKSKKIIYFKSISECKDRYHVFPNSLNWWKKFYIAFDTAVVRNSTNITTF